jgi:cleavage and polyadenylation specificity factor subunit 1
VAAIRVFKQPRTVEQLQAFLGLFNFYRRFVPAAAKILKMLTAALAGGQCGSAKLNWSAAMATAFADARVALADTELLDHPAVAAELSLTTGASAKHIGGVLQQWRPEKGWTLLGFFSKKLMETESRYSTFELLAVYNTIPHFRHYLEGRCFAVWTDHRPLVCALARLSDPRSDRQRRQLSFISEFTADIQYIAGNNNTVADTLRRPADAQQPLLSPRLTFAQVVAGAAVSCEACQRGRVSPAPRVLQMQLGDRQLLVDASYGVLRPLVPTVFGRTIFDAVHNVAHPGIRATRRLVSSRFMWPGLATDVAQWCKECAHCHRAKPSSRPATALHPLQVLLTRFTEDHVDLVGPLPTTAGGYQYLLTAITRQVDQVGRSHAAEDGVHRRLRGSLHCWMGQQVWDTGSADLRQGCTIHLRLVGGGYAAVGCQAQDGNRLSPTV